ncbi:MAG: hypothetical protein LBR88_02945 [Zoogloeaceae bacterium]|jgi:hypothetical protein|nr:hypothetical protein [Zoogloeaceae bacterium]
MGSYAFAAKEVATTRPGGECHLAGFAALDAKVYFMLQRAFAFDEQDVALGMDTYYVEWRGQEHAGYGGILRFVLKRGGADITFSPNMAENMDGMARLSISFQLAASEYLALPEALGCIFHGSGCLVVADA